MPRVPVRRDAVHLSNSTTAIRQRVTQASLDPPASSTTFNDSASVQDTSMFPMTTETNLFGDQETMPKVLLDSFDMPTGQDDYSFIAQAPPPPTSPHQTTFQDNNFFVQPQNPIQQLPQASDLCTFDQSNVFDSSNAYDAVSQINPFEQNNPVDPNNAFNPINAFDQANAFYQADASDQPSQFVDCDAAWPNTAPTTEHHAQPMQSQLQPQHQNPVELSNITWLPLTPDTTQTIWYTCRHNNPTGIGRSFCPHGCTPIDAIYQLAGQ